MTTFAVKCPHCLASDEDPFEVLARGDIDWTMCVSCGKKFYFLVVECQACEEESVFTWQAVPEPPWTRSLHCSHCGRPLELSDEALLNEYFRRK